MGVPCPEHYQEENGEGDEEGNACLYGGALGSDYFFEHVARLVRAGLFGFGDRVLRVRVSDGWSGYISSVNFLISTKFL